MTRNFRSIKVRNIGYATRRLMVVRGKVYRHSMKRIASDSWQHHLESQRVRLISSKQSGSVFPSRRLQTDDSWRGLRKSIQRGLIPASIAQLNVRRRG